MCASGVYILFENSYTFHRFFLKPSTIIFFLTFLRGKKHFGGWRFEGQRVERLEGQRGERLVVGGWKGGKVGGWKGIKVIEWKGWKVGGWKGRKVLG